MYSLKLSKKILQIQISMLFLKKLKMKKHDISAILLNYFLLKKKK